MISGLEVRMPKKKTSGSSSDKLGLEMVYSLQPKCLRCRGTGQVSGMIYDSEYIDSCSDCGGSGSLILSTAVPCCKIHGYRLLVVEGEGTPLVSRNLWRCPYDSKEIEEVK